jgi:hypothetical protein
MAAFLKDHGTGSVGIPPVAPDKAVRLMPVPYVKESRLWRKKVMSGQAIL